MGLAGHLCHGTTTYISCHAAMGERTRAPGRGVGALAAHSSPRHPPNHGAAPPSLLVEEKAQAVGQAVVLIIYSKGGACAHGGCMGG